ncbi:hypothetical protein J6590_095715 [Homalodisca vitripennis]|nr:hypothetical protein J6590_095715 [Homalodisca vitripennis]
MDDSPSVETDDQPVAQSSLWVVHIWRDKPAKSAKLLVLEIRHAERDHNPSLPLSLFPDKCDLYPGL